MQDQCTDHRIQVTGSAGSQGLNANYRSSICAITRPTAQKRQDQRNITPNALHMSVAQWVRLVACQLHHVMLDMLVPPGLVLVRPLDAVINKTKGACHIPYGSKIKTQRTKQQHGYGVDSSIPHPKGGGRGTGCVPCAAVRVLRRAPMRCVCWHRNPVSFLPDPFQFYGAWVRWRWWGAVRTPPGRSRKPDLSS